MKRILCLICVMLCAISLLCACQNKDLPYEAKLYDRAENLLTEEFLSENKIRPYGGFGGGDELPESRCIIIKNNDDFSFAFTSFPEELDFSQDTLVVYLFTDIYGGFECKLKEITENENEVVIVIEHDMPKRDEPLSSMPITRGLVVKLCNCNIDNFEIKLIYFGYGRQS